MASSFDPPGTAETVPPDRRRHTKIVSTLGPTRCKACDLRSVGDDAASRYQLGVAVLEVVAQLGWVVDGGWVDGEGHVELPL